MTDVELDIKQYNSEIHKMLSQVVRVGLNVAEHDETRSKEETIASAILNGLDAFIPIFAIHSHVFIFNGCNTIDEFEVIGYKCGRMYDESEDDYNDDYDEDGLRRSNVWFLELDNKYGATASIPVTELNKTLFDSFEACCKANNLNCHNVRFNMMNHDIDESDGN